MNNDCFCCILRDSNSNTESGVEIPSKTQIFPSNKPKLYNFPNKTKIILCDTNIFPSNETQKFHMKPKAHIWGNPVPPYPP